MSNHNVTRTINTTGAEVMQGTGLVTVHCTRFVYSKKVRPAEVEALLAKKIIRRGGKATEVAQVVGRMVWSNVNSVGSNDMCTVNPSEENLNVSQSPKTYNVAVAVDSMADQNKVTAKVISSPGVSADDTATAEQVSTDDGSEIAAEVISSPEVMVEGHKDMGKAPIHRGSVNNVEVSSPGNEHDNFTPIYDVNNVGIVDKFVNSILHVSQFNGNIPDVDIEIFHKWHSQSEFNFGFVPLGSQVLPDIVQNNNSQGLNPLEMHAMVKATKKPNYMQARLPVNSQLKVDAWKRHLNGYWDEQLVHLIEYGFPLDFNRNCPLINETANHKSATDFPSDIDAYIEEELKYDALLGPFKQHPIPSGHCSPFMSRPKPNSDRRRVIVDLSWPLGASVNAGIDKTSYLGSAFSLTFPTVDHITTELTRLGRGALIFKVDVSRAFRHVKVDPGDYDLLGLQWRDVYVDTCVPFGTRHGSQIFQRLSDGVRFIMRQKGFQMIDYIDDYVGVGVPSVAWASYEALLALMAELGLTVSNKKLVSPATCVTCLGVMIDTVTGTIAIPPEKLATILSEVRQWLHRDVASKRQLQSILGLLLYVHKCVRPARVFLNRMLDLLRSAHGRQKIFLTPEFKRDLRWFAKFLPTYNGVSLYDHKPIGATLELDACLTGFGGHCGRYVYHLPIVRGFMKRSIVHLEMVNILIAIRLFKFLWKGRKTLIKCDNEAVVSVLKTGRTRDPYLAACGRNIWYESAMSDIDLQYTHIRGTDNKIADVLSRWQGTTEQISWLYSHIHQPIWLEVSLDMLNLHPEL